MALPTVLREPLTLLLLLPVLLPLLPLELLLLLAGGVRAARGAALVAADVLGAVILSAGAHAPSVVDVAARRGERVASDAAALLLLVDPRDGLRIPELGQRLVLQRRPDDRVPRGEQFGVDLWRVLGLGLGLRLGLRVRVRVKVRVRVRVRVRVSVRVRVRVRVRRTCQTRAARPRG